MRDQPQMQDKQKGELVDKIITYFSENGQQYLQLLGQHIEISVIVVAIAAAIGIPAGIICSKWRFVQIFTEKFFGLLRIIPSLAILIICIPFMGTGLKPAIVALTILALPPILMNTAQGFLNLPQEIMEAATGMGMGNVRKFFRIKFPLAFPYIFTGLRTAVVEVIASATLASYIGAGGLGNIIFTGLGLMRIDLLYIGGISVALLSLIAGWVLDRIYRYQTRYLQL